LKYNIRKICRNFKWLVHTQFNESRPVDSKLIRRVTDTDGHTRVVVLETCPPLERGERG
jgi:hypothetical protein